MAISQYSSMNSSKAPKMKVGKPNAYCRNADVLSPPSNPAAGTAGTTWPARTTAARQALFPPAAARCAFRRSSTDCALPAWGVAGGTQLGIQRVFAAVARQLGRAFPCAHRARPAFA
jgi:hypothetical protein